MSAEQILFLLPLILVSATAVFTMLMIALKHSHAGSCLITAFGLAAALLSLFAVIPSIPQQVTALFIVDSFSSFFTGMILLVAIAITLFSYPYFCNLEEPQGEFYLLLSIATLGALVMAGSNHFITVFLGIETLNTPEKTPDDIDVTHMQSPGRTRETIPGLLSAADWSQEKQLWPTDPGDVLLEELADLTRGNVEAFVASSKVAAKGVETLSQDAAEYSRKSFEEASAALKGFAEVKSATDFFRLQSDYARSAFDSAVAETARLSETMLKFAGDVAEPITSRYSVAAERVKTLAL